MKVLVAGGAGYIGSHAVLSLLKGGHDVVVFDNLEHGHHEALEVIGKATAKEVIFVPGDLKKRDDIKALLDTHPDIDIVMHFAAYIEVGESVQSPMKYYLNNTYGTMNLLEEMLAHGLKKLVFSSTAAVYGVPQTAFITEEHPRLPINPYGQSKLMVEHMLDSLYVSDSFSSIRLRYFNVAGASKQGIIGENHLPESHLIPKILLGALGQIDRIAIYGDDYDTPDGTCIRDYIYVEDLVQAHLLAMNLLMNGTMAEAINLGSKNGYSVKEIVQACRETTGIDFQVVVEPRRAGDPPQLVADAMKAKTLLGWEASADLHTMLKTAWDWHKNHPNGYAS